MCREVSAIAFKAANFSLIVAVIINIIIATAIKPDVIPGAILALEGTGKGMKIVSMWLSQNQGCSNRSDYTRGCSPVD